MSIGAWARRVLASLFPSDESATDPDRIFQEALIATRQSFLDLRATATPMYQARDALRGQESARASRIEELGQKAATLLQAGQEKEALKAAAEQGRLEPELEKIRLELADLEKPIAQVDDRLRAIEGKIRDLEAERQRARAALAGADARVAVDRILAAGHGAGPDEDLAGARQQLDSRLAYARSLEEMAATSTEAQMAALESGLEEDAARVRLEAIRAKALPPGAPNSRPDDEDAPKRGGS